MCHPERSRTFASGSRRFQTSLFVPRRLAALNHDGDVILGFTFYPLTRFAGALPEGEPKSCFALATAGATEGKCNQKPRPMGEVARGRGFPEANEMSFGGSP